jgi:hypothetical protein
VNDRPWSQDPLGAVCSSAARLLRRTLSSMTEVYFGLIDDFAVNHWSGQAIQSVSSLNAHLIRAVFYGDPLLLNDGHVVLNPAVRDAVLQPTASPFSNLSESGFVKVLTRNRGDLGSLTANMASKSISSAARELEKSSNDHRYQHSLDDLSARLKQANSFKAWPSYQINRVFSSVSKVALNGVEDDYSQRGLSHLVEEVNRFKDELGANVRSRTGWEDTADRLKGTAQISEETYRRLMLAACEAHHYSWGCMLTESELSIRVQTRSPLYLSIFDRITGDVPPQPPMRVTIKIPDITQRFAEQTVGHRWKLLVEVAQEKRFIDMKYDFLAALTRYHTAVQPSERDKKDLDSLGKKYAQALTRHFNRKEGLGAVMDVTFLSTGIAGAVAGVALPPVGIAVGISSAVGAFAAPLFRRHVLWRLQPKKTRKWTSGLEVAVPETSEASFELSMPVVSKFVGDKVPYGGGSAVDPSK